jgi:hypothetical protein
MAARVGFGGRGALQLAEKYSLYAVLKGCGFKPRR